MLRDKNLIPLSHQHQHALALCVRIERALPIDDIHMPEWQAEIIQLFRSEIAIHFAAEEDLVFQAAVEFQELIPLVTELRGDHDWLREQFGRAVAGSLSGNDLSALSQRLATHIRKEERQLFERLQQWMPPDTLRLLGQKLQEALKDAAHICTLPTNTTALRAQNDHN